MAKKKKKKEEYQFQEGNKEAEKWSDERMIEILEDCYQEVYNNPNRLLSIADVLVYVRATYKMSSSSFFAKVKANKVLESIKSDINILLLSRINKGSIEGDYNATACIWRMKQLGERDPDKQDQVDALKGLAFKVTQD